MLDEGRERRDSRPLCSSPTTAKHCENTGSRARAWAWQPDCAISEQAQGLERHRLAARAAGDHEQRLPAISMSIDHGRRPGFQLSQQQD
jgi:hypothetical protein